MGKLNMIIVIVLTTFILLGGHHVLAQDRSTSKGRMQGRYNVMDTNKDGKISHDEYMAYHQQIAEKRFQSMDTNGDGFVNQQEHEEAVKEFKGKMRRRWKEKGSDY